MKTELCQQLLKLYHNIAAPTVEEMQVYAGCVNLIHPAAVPANTDVRGAMVAGLLSAAVSLWLSRKQEAPWQVLVALAFGSCTFLLTLLLTSLLRGAT